MNSRLETIREIAVRNELNFIEVMEIYTRFNMRVYLQNVKKGDKMLLYDPVLEERTMKLTEKYFDIKKIKDLNKLR